MRPKSRTLSLNNISALAQTLTVRLIMTHRDDLVIVNTKTSVGDAKRKMEPNAQGGSKFDQLPVENNGVILGVVRYSHIKSKPEDIRLNEDGYIDYSVAKVKDTTPIGDLMVKLLTDCCVLVDSGSVINGLVHISDLNKQAVRLYYYLWLASVEMGLLEKLKRKYGANQDWIDLLDSQSKINVLENLALAQRDNLDIHPLEYCDFSDLVNIVTKDKHINIWSEMGFKGKKDWKRESGKLVTLRHKIMHPVRTLISECSYVKNLHECEDSLQRIVKGMNSVA